MQLLWDIASSYLHHHPDEHDRLERLRQLLAATAPEDIISRRNFAGHATASGFVIDRVRRTVLLVYHKGLGIYVQPGGHLDPLDASPIDGARREIAEETGIQALVQVSRFDDQSIPFDIDIHHIPANPTKGEPEHWHHDFRYAFWCESDTALTLAPSEVSDARWVPVDALGGYPTFESVALKIGRLFDL